MQQTQSDKTKIKCLVQGCTETHPTHKCKNCGDNNSNHFSRDCYKLQNNKYNKQVNPQNSSHYSQNHQSIQYNNDKNVNQTQFDKTKIECLVQGCTELHASHKCKICGDNNSDHFSRDCNKSQNNKYNKQVNQQNSSYYSQNDQSIQYNKNKDKKVQQTQSDKTKIKCLVQSCIELHATHKCKNCGDGNSNHFSRDCSKSQNNKYNNQVNPQNDQFHIKNKSINSPNSYNKNTKFNNSKPNLKNIKLFMIRHDERMDAYPNHDISQYESNAPFDPFLTEKGLNHANETGKQFKDQIKNKYQQNSINFEEDYKIDFKSVFSSLAIRCVQTANEMNKSLNLPLIIIPGLTQCEAVQNYGGIKIDDKCKKLYIKNQPHNQKKYIGIYLVKKYFKTKDELEEIINNKILLISNNKDISFRKCLNDLILQCNTKGIQNIIILTHREAIREISRDQSKPDYSCVAEFDVNITDDEIKQKFLEKHNFIKFE